MFNLFCLDYRSEMFWGTWSRAYLKVYNPSDRWFGTCFIFHNIWDNPSIDFHIFQRGSNHQPVKIYNLFSIWLVVWNMNFMFPSQLTNLYMFQRGRHIYHQPAITGMSNQCILVSLHGPPLGDDLRSVRPETMQAEGVFLRVAAGWAGRGHDKWCGSTYNVRPKIAKLVEISPITIVSYWGL